MFKKNRKKLVVQSHTVLHDIISNCSSVFHSQSLNIRSPHCLSYISHDLSYESLVLIRQNSLVIPSFFSLLFCLRMFCFRKQNRYSFLVTFWSGRVKKDNLIESWRKDQVRKPSFIQEFPATGLTLHYGISFITV